MLARLKKLDPARLYALIGTIFILLTTLGFTWATDRLQTAIIGVIAAVISLITGEATRTQVVSNDKVLAFVDDPEKSTPEVLPGNAVVSPARADEVLDAATTYGRHAAKE